MNCAKYARMAVRCHGRGVERPSWPALHSYQPNCRWPDRLLGENSEASESLPRLVRYPHVTFVAAEGLQSRERCLALVAGEFHSELLGAAPAAREVFMLPVTIGNKIRLRVPEAIDRQVLRLAICDPDGVPPQEHRPAGRRRNCADRSALDQPILACAAIVHDTRIFPRQCSHLWTTHRADLGQVLSAGPESAPGGLEARVHPVLPPGVYMTSGGKGAGMRTDAEGLAGLVPAPRGPGGRHAKPSSPPEPDFDYERPLLIDIGRAAVIAEALRECGYPRCTADAVVMELARPQRERSIIGRFAADQLARAGWRP
jgi:hypothetical protein